MSEQQRATVDCRRGNLIVASYSRTTAGFWVMNGEYQVLESAVDSTALGVAVRLVLDKSGAGVAVPDRSALPIAPLLDELGLKTVSAYLNGAKSVGLRKEESITLYPKRNAGSRGGFVEIQEAEVKVEPDVSASQLGNAVRRALALAQ